MNIRTLICGFIITSLLSSCQFSCNVDDNTASKPGDATRDRGNPRLKNEIRIRESGVKVEKAYLVFASGERVPEGNVVDFSEPVRLMLWIEDGWKEVDGRVMLGASEKIEIENEGVLLDEEDLFADESGKGLSPYDARIITLTANIRLKQQVSPLQAFIVSFRVWDKNGPGYVSGSYKLYAK